jgi:succinate dehydrogenase/fumarate reductase-like Fe-S protein
MTKQEIRDEAKKRYSSNEELDAFCRSAYCLGAEMVNEKQPYTAEDMKKLLYNLEMQSKEIIDMQTGIRHLVIDWSFVEAQFKAFGIEIEHYF